MELRALTAQNLQQELSIVANPAQLMLTHGASQALTWPHARWCALATWCWWTTPATPT